MNTQGERGGSKIQKCPKLEIPLHCFLPCPCCLKNMNTFCVFGRGTGTSSWNDHKLNHISTRIFILKQIDRLKKLQHMGLLSQDGKCIFKIYVVTTLYSSSSSSFSCFVTFFITPWSWIQTQGYFCLIQNDASWRRKNNDRN